MSQVALKKPVVNDAARQRLELFRSAAERSAPLHCRISKTQTVSIKGVIVAVNTFTGFGKATTKLLIYVPHATSCYSGNETIFQETTDANGAPVYGGARIDKKNDTIFIKITHSEKFEGMVAQWQQRQPGFTTLGREFEPVVGGSTLRLNAPEGLKDEPQPQTPVQVELTVYEWVPPPDEPGAGASGRNVTGVGLTMKIESMTELAPPNPVLAFAAYTLFPQLCPFPRESFEDIKTAEGVTFIGEKALSQRFVMVPYLPTDSTCQFMVMQDQGCIADLGPMPDGSDPDVNPYVAKTKTMGNIPIADICLGCKAWCSAEQLQSGALDEFVVFTKLWTRHVTTFYGVTDLSAWLKLGPALVHQTPAFFGGFVDLAESAKMTINKVAGEEKKTFGLALAGMPPLGDLAGALMGIYGVPVSAAFVASLVKPGPNGQVSPDWWQSMNPKNPYNQRASHIQVITEMDPRGVPGMLAQAGKTTRFFAVCDRIMGEEDADVLKAARELQMDPSYNGPLLEMLLDRTWSVQTRNRWSERSGVDVPDDHPVVKFSTPRWRDGPSCFYIYAVDVCAYEALLKNKAMAVMLVGAGNVPLLIPEKEDNSHAIAAAPEKVDEKRKRADGDDDTDDTDDDDDDSASVAEKRKRANSEGPD